MKLKKMIQVENLTVFPVYRFLLNKKFWLCNCDCALGPGNTVLLSSNELSTRSAKNLKCNRRYLHIRQEELVLKCIANQPLPYKGKTALEIKKETGYTSIQSILNRMEQARLIFHVQSTDNYRRFYWFPSVQPETVIKQIQNR